MDGNEWEDPDELVKRHCKVCHHEFDDVEIADVNICPGYKHVTLREELGALYDDYEWVI